MDKALAYRIWQAPYAERKLRPLLRHNDLSAVKRVLDVGCGPGTNARHFEHVDYLGLDRNEEYVEYARRRYAGKFITTDVRSYQVPTALRFDFILVNSFLHHIDLENTRRILSHLHDQLTEDGHIHILELVLPERRSVARVLANWDRGEFPRPLHEWHSIFTEFFETVVFEPYSLKALGVSLWKMIYFKGRRKN
jgi:SAM-dependent methyltransferase